MAKVISGFADRRDFLRYVERTYVDGQGDNNRARTIAEKLVNAIEDCCEILAKVRPDKPQYVEVEVSGLDRDYQWKVAPISKEVSV